MGKMENSDQKGLEMNSSFQDQKKSSLKEVHFDHFRNDLAEPKLPAVRTFNDQSLRKDHEAAMIILGMGMQMVKSLATKLAIKRGFSGHERYLKSTQQDLNLDTKTALAYLALSTQMDKTLFDLIGVDGVEWSEFDFVEPSYGVWVRDTWMPEEKFNYAFFDDKGSYWVRSASKGGFYVSKLYAGPPMQTTGFRFNDVVFGVNDNPDYVWEYYVGTRQPIKKEAVHDFLKSVGLTDLMKAFEFSDEVIEPDDEPYGEPPPENWYWDELPTRPSELSETGVFSPTQSNPIPAQKGTCS